MKKITSFLLILSVIFLSSCTSKHDDNTSTTITNQSTTIITTTEESHTSSSVQNNDPNTKFFYNKEITVDPSDPYSAFMKKHCEEYAKAWEGRAKEDGNTIDIFNNYIVYHPDVYYYLYDLDKDGTNELLLGSWQKIGYYTEEPDPPKKICISSVYTIQDGEVVKLDTNTWWSLEFVWDRVLLSNGVIMTTWGVKENPHCSFFKFEKSKPFFRCGLIHDDKNQNILIKDIKESDKTIISKAENDRIYNEMCGNSSVVDINWKRIDEYGS